MRDRETYIYFNLHIFAFQLPFLPRHLPDAVPFTKTRSRDGPRMSRRWGVVSRRCRVGVAGASRADSTPLFIFSSSRKKWRNSIPSCLHLILGFYISSPSPAGRNSWFTLTSRDTERRSLTVSSVFIKGPLRLSKPCFTLFMFFDSKESSSRQKKNEDNSLANKCYYFKMYSIETPFLTRMTSLLATLLNSFLKGQWLADWCFLSCLVYCKVRGVGKEKTSISGGAVPWQ